MDDADQHAPGSPTDAVALESAIFVIGLVREQLGLVWTDLALGQAGAQASFTVGAAAAADLEVRRRDLLVDYIGRIAEERADRIERRRARSLDLVAGAQLIRAYGVRVREHVVAVRNAYAKAASPSGLTAPGTAVVDR